MLPFIDLQAQRARIKDRIDAAIARVLDHGRFVLGPEVGMLEAQLAAYGRAKHCHGNASGTDSLGLALMAWGIGPGDAVFCPSFTFAATAEVVAWFGATPVFVDVRPDTYTMAPAELEAAIEAVVRDGALEPRVVIAVDLFGQPADYPALCSICQKYGLDLIADSAQSFGCTLNGEHPLHWADCETTSFFPAKPLGCYGDGGAILTNNDQDIDLIRSLALHGAGEDKYDNVRIGMNSRLDTIQAAILIEKLAIFDDEIRLRNEVADRYAHGLEGVVRTPRVIEGGVSTWAQYTIEADDREQLAAYLRERGIPSAQYYPIPLHKQTAYEGYPVGAGGMAVSERIAKRVISLPMHAYLEAEAQEKIMSAIHSFYRAGS